MKCKSLNDITYDFHDVCDSKRANSTKPDGIFCQEGKTFNEGANLLLIPAEESLKLLFSRTNGIFSFDSLAIFFFVYFGLLLMTSGLAIANGLFVPMMLLGATYGRFIGQSLQIWFSGNVTI